MRLSSAVAHLSHAVRTCTRIATEPRFAGRRGSLLATYLRVRGRRLLRVRHRDGDAHAVAGFHVASFDCFSLDYLFDEIFVGLEYHFETASDAPVIVDCGSNIGMSVLFFKWLHPRARIVAFEPGERAFSLLQENVRRNRLADVTVHNRPVGDDEGTIVFHVDPGDPGSFMMSAFESRMPKATREVQMVRLSTLIDGPVDFLKLDVEGAELDVLRDLQRSGRLRLISQMVIEYHHHLAEDHDRLSELLAILESSGFGYQVASPGSHARERGAFQDLLLWVYRKEGAAVIGLAGDGGAGVREVSPAA